MGASVAGLKRLYITKIDTVLKCDSLGIQRMAKNAIVVVLGNMQAVKLLKTALCWYAVRQLLPNLFERSLYGTEWRMHVALTYGKKNTSPFHGLTCLPWQNVLLQKAVSHTKGLLFTFSAWCWDYEWLLWCSVAPGYVRLSVLKTGMSKLVSCSLKKKLVLSEM